MSRTVGKKRRPHGLHYERVSKTPVKHPREILARLFDNATAETSSGALGHSRSLFEVHNSPPLEMAHHSAPEFLDSNWLFFCILTRVVSVIACWHLQCNCVEYRMIFIICERLHGRSLCR
ncbi:MAG: hypothetical protein NBKEAIPA_03617 [Nitrospirae bacterium]|nr:MAG: hypothetical protein UZ03_NOB001000237 [Nitrospira sp. OLB3]MBV6471682.1 hypothetical protein [Nitrospirota bacterium]